MSRAGWIAAGTAALAGTVGALGFALGRGSVVRHVDPYARHWGSLLDGERDDALIHVALGDSAAQGVGAATVDDGYVPVLARRLAKETGREIRVVNFSVSGATTGDVVALQLPKLAALDVVPDLVTMDIGANDAVFPGHSVDTFTESFEEILQAIPAGSFVADVPWIPLPRIGGQARAMAVVAREMIARHGHHLVDIHESSRALGLLRYRLRLSSDWFHPNSLGYREWSEKFHEAIAASGWVEAHSSESEPVAGKMEG